MKKILLMAGHGDGDPGAVALGYQEAELTRELTESVRVKLSSYAEVTVFDMSRNPYKWLKANKFNFKKYNYVLEIHFNAAVNDRVGDGKTTGSEILVHPTEKGTNVEQCILKRITALGFRGRGIKRRDNLQNMNLCKRNQGVSYALLETCFIDDRDDMNLYTKKKNAVAEAIAMGIVEGFGLKAKENATMGFNDIKGHYAESAVTDLLSMGIVKGNGDGTFSPDSNIKRGDAAIMVRNAIKFITGK